MRFDHPAWLAAGAFACLALLALWRIYDARQHAALARFVSAHLRVKLTQSVSIGRRRLQRLLLLLSVALLFVALAGPLVGYRWELIQRRGIDIVFAIDTSRSMSTPDVRPDRLTRAKLAIDDFTNALDGDAVGLVAFAGSAFVVCPITLDYGAFHESLSAVDTSTIPRGGTNTASAIRESQNALRRRPGSNKIMILVTDGEDLEGDALVAAQNAAHQDGMKIFTIGVGTAQGDLIPISANQNSGFVKDDAGAYVKSRLDEPALKAIAAATGGLYAPLGAQGEGLAYIYRTALAPMLKHDLASRQQKVYTQRYQWPLAASLALLLLSLLIGTRRRVRAPARASERVSVSAARSSSLDTAAVSLMLAALTLMPAGTVRASTSSAEAAYKKGDFAAAAKEYAAEAARDPKKPVLEFNAGAAAYRAGQFPQAAKAFQESISRAPSGDAGRLAEQQDAYYNLGNTLYRSGQATEAGSPQQTIETWTQAVKAYDTALQLRANDADSKFNRDFVQRKIDELKQKQNSPQNQQQNQQKNQSQNQSQNNQGNQPQNSGQPPNGQPPNGQPPPGQQPPQQGQPPQQQGQPPPGQQPPQQQGQPPNTQQPPGQPPPQQPPQQQGQQPPPNNGEPKPGNGEPKPAPGGEPPPQNGARGGADQGENQEVPGQMTPEEARELLDSQKGEERRALGMPNARRDAQSPPDKPYKDW
jgi:Ca-activated chloride channel homolog